MAKNMDLKNDETFLEAAFGNFSDCIKNLVYGLQLYNDISHMNTNKICCEFDKVGDPTTKKILKFFIVEAENISKAKAIVFAMDSMNLLKKKYCILINKIKSDNSKNQYEISVDAYIYLTEFQEKINLNDIQKKKYKKKEDNDVYKFEKFMNDEFNKYCEIDFVKYNKALTKDQLISILNCAFDKLHDTMVCIQNMVDDSNSNYITACLCREIISILIATYSAVSTIDFYN